MGLGLLAGVRDSGTNQASGLSMMDTEIVGQDRRDLAELSVEAWDAILDSQSPNTLAAPTASSGGRSPGGRDL